MYFKKFIPILFSLVMLIGCQSIKHVNTIYSTNGKINLDSHQIWLTHEHILVDFIGADKISTYRWDRDTVMSKILPFFDKLKTNKVGYFVDATPNYLGRDVLLLDAIAKKTGIEIITTTGYYGARNSQFIPDFAFKMSSKAIAAIWIKEFEEGINDTSIKPGFIKIGIDNKNPLDSMHQKLVEAAAITHLKTGLTIASHTGKATGLWPQIDILKKLGVAPDAFIWVHAQQENDFENFIKAAKLGCWISFDGLGWEIDNHIEKLIFAKQNHLLHRILISHDAGWYDPQKTKQRIVPYTNLFELVIPRLKSHGFTSSEIDQLIKINPVKAFSLSKNQIR